MNRSAVLRIVPLLLSLLAVACQQTKKTETTPVEQIKPTVATLSKPAYTLGDSITIRLNQPVTRVTFAWDDAPARPAQPVDSSLRIESTGKTTGLHQLVINSVTANKATITDTLTIDLWSDIKPRRLSYSVQQTYPHQSGSFTQGLEFYKGVLYEGTGLNGESKLMKVDLSTGAILQSVPLSANYFGEGITILNDHIYQLTWTSRQCFRYTMNLVPDKILTYHTQGWGLTHRDTTLIVSDGSNRLSFYTPDFRKTGELAVYDDKGPVLNLNELEYINGYVVANVWQTNRIVQIDMTSGKVVADLLIDSPALVNVNTQENVLNGIAFQPPEQALFITGKKWPLLVKIRVDGLFSGQSGQHLTQRSPAKTSGLPR